MCGSDEEDEDRLEGIRKKGSHPVASYTFSSRGKRLCEEHHRPVAVDSVVRSYGRLLRFGLDSREPVPLYQGPSGGLHAPNETSATWFALADKHTDECSVHVAGSVVMVMVMVVAHSMRALVCFLFSSTHLFLHQDGSCCRRTSLAVRLRNGKREGACKYPSRVSTLACVFLVVGAAYYPFDDRWWDADADADIGRSIPTPFLARCGPSAGQHFRPR